MLSTTVTMAVPEEALPAASLTVSTTAFAPISAQVNEARSMLISAMPQLSVLPPSSISGVMTTSPFASSSATIFCTFTSGSVVSVMVTMAVAELWLPASSITVRVTSCWPIALQSKEETSRLISAMSQLSELPLSTSSGAMPTVPSAPISTVISCVITLGLSVSSTVI